MSSIRPGDIARVKVACVNWTQPDTPIRHAVLILDAGGHALLDAYFATLADAIAYVDRLREACARCKT